MFSFNFCKQYKIVSSSFGLVLSRKITQWRWEHQASLDKIIVFAFARKKKLRFHPRQLYPAAKQGEVQRVLLMLSEWQKYLAHFIYDSVLSV